MNDIDRRRCPGGLGLISLGSLLAFADPAFGAGGAHVIDDADVETAGHCHLENWLTHFDSHRGLINLSPACTRKAWPSLEIGGAVQHLWDDRSDWTAGPTLKLNLRSPDRGMGIALSGATAWSLRSGRLETASLIVPATIPVGKAVQINLNGGWTYARGSRDRHAVFYGAQAMVDAGSNVSLMAELFRRGSARPGAQAGLRWNPGGGRVDVDLLAGHRVDGTSSGALTFGLTIRT